MENSRLYIEQSEVCRTFSALQGIKDFINRTNEPVYVLSAPLTEKKYTTSYRDGLIVLSPHRKILFVSLNNSKNDDSFDDYVEDTLEDVGSISDRYNFKEAIGRPRRWKGVLTETANLNELGDFWQFYTNESLVVQKLEDVRKISIIVSLFIGSINNADKVGIDVPQNMLDLVKYKIQLFDGDQTRFVYDDPPAENKLIRIQGLSGTGKTELLLHKLKDVYVSEPEARIAFTCYSKVLADSLIKRIPEFFDFVSAQRQIDPDRLFCFHSWGKSNNIKSGFYRYVCAFYGVPFFNFRETRSFASACKTTKAQIEKKEKETGASHNYAFKYVFLDESQDFTQEFFDLCEFVTEKRVFAAGDVFQSIYSTPDDKMNMKADYLLYNCYRTDPRTFMVAQSLGMGLLEPEKISWLTDEGWKACGYNVEKKNEGNDYVLTRQPISRFGETQLDPSCFKVVKSNIESTKIVGIISSLKKEFPNLTPDDVCVILLDSDDYIYDLVPSIRNQVYQYFNWESNVVYETKEKIKGQLFISNYRNVKGLEFPFVICCTKKLNNDLAYRNRLYTMISRSFLRTYMIVSESADNGFTPELLSKINGIINDKCIETRKPTEEELRRMKDKIHVFKERVSTREKVEQILKAKKIDVSNAQKVLDFVHKTENPNPTDDELEDTIDTLIQMKYIANK